MNDCYNNVVKWSFNVGVISFKNIIKIFGNKIIFLRPVDCAKIN